LCSRRIEINDSVSFDVLRILKVQEDHSERQVFQNLRIKMKDRLAALAVRGLCSLRGHPGDSTYGHGSPLLLLSTFNSPSNQAKTGIAVALIPESVSGFSSNADTTLCAKGHL
jgi:hypothetical protein